MQGLLRASLGPAALGILLACGMLSGLAATFA